jgi:hypothetical protein
LCRLATNDSSYRNTGLVRSQRGYPDRAYVSLLQEGGRIRWRTRQEVKRFPPFGTLVSLPCCEGALPGLGPSLRGSGTCECCIVKTETEDVPAIIELGVQIMNLKSEGVGVWVVVLDHGSRPLQEELGWGPASSRHPHYQEEPAVSPRSPRVCPSASAEFVDGKEPVARSRVC